MAWDNETKKKLIELLQDSKVRYQYAADVLGLKVTSVSQFAFRNKNIIPAREYTSTFYVSEEKKDYIARYYTEKTTKELSMELGISTSYINKYINAHLNQSKRKRKWETRKVKEWEKAVNDIPEHLCWSCKLATNRTRECSWADRGMPVERWKIKGKGTIHIQKYTKNGKLKDIEVPAFDVVECPLYQDERPDKIKLLGDEEFKRMLREDKEYDDVG